MGLIGAVWWILKRVKRAKHPELEARGDLIDVVSTTQLGPNRALHLVRVGEELVVLGATEHAITAVARLSGEEALAAWSPDHGAHDARPGSVHPSGREGLDARARASATSRDASVLERLRALTVRR
jgi:flagellar protein FliO/FliZ